MTAFAASRRPKNAIEVCIDETRGMARSLFSR
jgi:hypothetical protein